MCQVIKLICANCSNEADKDDVRFPPLCKNCSKMIDNKFCFLCSECGEKL